MNNESEPVIESRIELTDRLRREGRWQAANEFREQERQRLRKEGVARQEAVERAWASMAEKFPPLPVAQAAPVQGITATAVKEQALKLGRMMNDVLERLSEVSELVPECNRQPPPESWEDKAYYASHELWFLWNDVFSAECSLSWSLCELMLALKRVSGITEDDIAKAPRMVPPALRDPRPAKS